MALQDIDSVNLPSTLITYFVPTGAYTAMTWYYSNNSLNGIDGPRLIHNLPDANTNFFGFSNSADINLKYRGVNYPDTIHQQVGILNFPNYANISSIALILQIGTPVSWNASFVSNIKVHKLNKNVQASIPHELHYDYNITNLISSIDIVVPSYYISSTHSYGGRIKLNMNPDSFENISSGQVDLLFKITDLLEYEYPYSIANVIINFELTLP